MNNSDGKKSGNVKSGKRFIAPVLSLAVAIAVGCTTYFAAMAAMGMGWKRRLVV